jgi:hypothetical protein
MWYERDVQKEVGASIHRSRTHYYNKTQNNMYKFWPHTWHDLFITCNPSNNQIILLGFSLRLQIFSSEQCYYPKNKPDLQLKLHLIITRPTDARLRSIPANLPPYMLSPPVPANCNQHFNNEWEISLYIANTPSLLWSFHSLQKWNILQTDRTRQQTFRREASRKERKKMCLHNEEHRPYKYNHSWPPASKAIIATSNKPKAPHCPEYKSESSL